MKYIGTASRPSSVRSGQASMMILVRRPGCHWSGEAGEPVMEMPLTKRARARACVALQ